MKREKKIKNQNRKSPFLNLKSTPRPINCLPFSIKSNKNKNCIKYHKRQKIYIYIKIHRSEKKKKEGATTVEHVHSFAATTTLFVIINS